MPIGESNDIDMGRSVCRRCPLCGSEEVEVAMRCTDHFVSGEVFPVCACKSCGFHFTGDVPAADEMGRYYQSCDYISHSDTSRGLVNKVYHLVRWLMLREKSGLVSHFTGKRQGRVLDYGAGTGYFANRMRQVGWEVEAVEPGDSARAFAFAHFGIKMRVPGDLEGFAPGSFDCVTLWHVLEHVADLHDKMDCFARLLSPDGLLVLALPNRTSYDARRYGDAWAAWDVPRHLWHFAPSDVLRLGNAHGFSLVEMLPMHFDAFYISMMSEKGRGARLPFLRGLVAGTAALMRTLANKERSSSLIYVMKKK